RHNEYSTPHSGAEPHNMPRHRRVCTWGKSLDPPAFPLGGAHVRYVAVANGADAAETAENGSSGGQDDLFLLSLVTRVRTRPARCAYANGFSVRVYFVCRYSWIPSAPPSRPTPDCRHPPKAAAALELTPLSSPIIPVASRPITRWPRPSPAGC